jgi:hypothetical protein
MREDGGITLVNFGHQKSTLRFLKALKKALDHETDLHFDKERFTVGFICEYLGQVNFFKNAIIEQIEDTRFSAHTLETCQGLQKSLIVKNIPNDQLSQFAGDEKRNLVADSRFRCGMVTVISDTAVNLVEYNFRNPEYSTENERTRHVYSFYPFAVREGNVYQEHAETL